jgi:chromosomal replication initiator protein
MPAIGSLTQLAKLELDLYDLREKLSVTLAMLEEQRFGVLNPKIVLKVVSEAYGIPVGYMISKNRTKEMIMARQVAQYLMKVVLGMSYPAIARATNVAHHTTALYSVEKIRKLRAQDGAFHVMVGDLERGLRGVKHE